MKTHKVVIDLRDSRGKTWICAGEIGDTLTGAGSEKGLLSELREMGRIHVIQARIVVEE